MKLEKLRQQGARRLRHVRASSAFDLRDVRLADGFAQLLADGAHQFELGQGAVEAAQRTFHLAQVTDFLAQRHIKYRNIYIAICDCLSRTRFGVFPGGWGCGAAAPVRFPSSLSVCELP